MNKAMQQHLDAFTQSASDHFEYEEHEDNADSLAPINDIGVFGIKVGTVRSLAGSLGNIFGGKKEDTSDVGFKAFTASGGGASNWYPTKDEMIQAAQQGGWEKVEPPAIQASYNPQDGTWKRGDWNFKVVSSSPIQAKAFKGAKESGLLKSPVNAKVPVNQAPSQATPTAASQGTTPQSVAPQTTNSSGMTATSPQISSPSNSQPGGQPVNTPGGSPQNAGAASLTDQVKNLFPTGGSATGGQTMIYVIVGVIVVGLILFLALKK